MFLWTGGGSFSCGRVQVWTVSGVSSYYMQKYKNVLRKIFENKYKKVLTNQIQFCIMILTNTKTYLKHSKQAHGQEVEK